MTGPGLTSTGIRGRCCLSFSFDRHGSSIELCNESADADDANVLDSHGISGSGTYLGILPSEEQDAFRWTRFEVGFIEETDVS